MSSNNVEIYIKILKQYFSGQKDIYLQNNRMIRDELLDEHLHNHLNGNSRIGIYPIHSSNKTSFFVIDIDRGIDSFPLALLLKQKAESIGIHGYIERSLGKGFHIWFFFKNHVLGKSARNFGKIILNLADENHTKIDFFPKQDEVTKENPHGNAINLPFFNIKSNICDKGKNIFLDEYEKYVDQIRQFNNLFLISEEKLNDVINKNSKLLSAELVSPKKDKLTSLVTPSVKLFGELTLLKTLQEISPYSKKKIDKVKMATKTNRSDADVEYAKHLAELLFSKELISHEIKLHSNKYSDKNLRGQHKEKYLLDKVEQFNDIREFLAGTLNPITTKNKNIVTTHPSQDKRNLID